MFLTTTDIRWVCSTRRICPTAATTCPRRQPTITIMPTDMVIIPAAVVIMEEQVAIHRSRQRIIAPPPATPPRDSTTAHRRGSIHRQRNTIRIMSVTTSTSSISTSRSSTMKEQTVVPATSNRPTTIPTSTSTAPQDTRVR